MTVNNHSIFREQEVLHELKHYLPAQAPLKDFVHHNTLHAFQHLGFDKAIYNASAIFGYRVSLSMAEYRSLFACGKISPVIVDRTIAQKKGPDRVDEWKGKMLSAHYQKELPRIGMLRSHWKREYHVDLDSLVQPLLFRILCAYLDQGISMWNFPIWHKGFLASICDMEQRSFSSFFKTKRAKALLLDGKANIPFLLNILVGDEHHYAQYLFDQQFSHQGWSGMVSAIEDNPQTLLDPRKISIHDLIVFELLLEIDALDYMLNTKWQPLAQIMKSCPTRLFAEVRKTELDEVTMLWQESLEWSYYDEVLKGLQNPKSTKGAASAKTFQAIFCIDDRECSHRRYLEQVDPACETFGTPGFFGVEFFFQPDHGKFYDKLCPAPITPTHLIKEIGIRRKHEKDAHFTKHTHGLFRGWVTSQTLGFWSAIRLLINIFRPSMSPATASSTRHMDRHSKLTIANKRPDHREHGLQVGFTIEEMTQRVEGLVRSIGLVKDFAPLIYVVGHGSSSVNNPHYAAYDCGACSGRAGSVNSRVICFMANHPEVRKILESKGLIIPVQTQFVGALHDTTRDEIMFFDEGSIAAENSLQHQKNEQTFYQALDLNSKERARRFDSINTKMDLAKVHEKIKLRSVSLFETRPELNHATNSVCIVGRRKRTKHLFLDRRAFLNSYDYSTDRDGSLLLDILKPLGPVCGGINLEYFFSRVDNQKLGAGTKLPHNVMGLFGVANGIEGDLRPGLPSQMIEIHDPIRLLMVVEHFPEVVLQTIQQQSAVYEWYINQWIHLIAINPETLELSVFRNGEFNSYSPLKQTIGAISNLSEVIETHDGNLPVYTMA